mmetsp:Transcript_33664/g.68725  ORF Transcript_33664/g.68725 Transcript_33664/m.68725 type:complete len:217 (+) Transcript_33664:505-1155(+)
MICSWLCASLLCTRRYLRTWHRHSRLGRCGRHCSSGSRKWGEPCRCSSRCLHFRRPLCRSASGLGVHCLSMLLLLRLLHLCCCWQPRLWWRTHRRCCRSRSASLTLCHRSKVLAFFGGGNGGRLWSRGWNRGGRNGRRSRRHSCPRNRPLCRRFRRHRREVFALRPRASASRGPSHGRWGRGRHGGCRRSDRRYRRNRARRGGRGVPCRHSCEIFS